MSTNLNSEVGREDTNNPYDLQHNLQRHIPRNELLVYFDNMHINMRNIVYQIHEEYYRKTIC